MTDKIIYKTVRFLLILIGIATIFMFLSIFFSPSLRIEKNNIAQSIVFYGCSINKFAPYLLLSFFIAAIAGITINHNDLKKISNQSFFKTLSESINFDYNKSTGITLILYSLSQLMFVLYMFAKLSYMYNHCS